MKDEEFYQAMRANGFVKNTAGEWVKPKRASGGHSGKSHPIVQEQQDAGQGKDDYQPQKPGVDGLHHQKHRITVTFRYSDQRIRDMDGSLSTLLDCLVTARRQATIRAEDHGGGGRSSKGRRRLRNNH